MRTLLKLKIPERLKNDGKCRLSSSIMILAFDEGKNFIKISHLDVRDIV